MITTDRVEVVDDITSARTSGWDSGDGYQYSVWVRQMFNIIDNPSDLCDDEGDCEFCEYAEWVDASVPDPFDWRTGLGKV